MTLLLKLLVFIMEIEIPSNTTNYFATMEVNNFTTEFDYNEKVNELYFYTRSGRII